MPAKLERCVRKVKKQKGTKSAWAICAASMKKKKKKHHSANDGSFIDRRRNL